MAQDETFNAAEIAQQLANANKTQPPLSQDPDAPVKPTLADAAKAISDKADKAAEIEPKKVEDDASDNDRKMEPDSIPDRDDVVIRKKKAKTEPKSAEPEDEDDTAPADNDSVSDDSDDDEDFGEPSEGGEDGEEPETNFTKLRKSQKKYKKMALDYKKKIDELEPLKRYRDIVDLSLSPEFHETYPAAREKMVEQATELGELYGVDPEQLKTVFDQPNIKEAKAELSYIAEDEDTVKELSTIVRDFYINKTKEEKELQVADPKARFQQLKEERERRISAAKAAKVEGLKMTKQKTADDLKLLLDDPNQAKVLWKGLYHKDLSKYIETNLPEKFREQAEENYGKLYDSLTAKGADLSFDDSRKIAMLTADASMGIMANKVISILLDTLHSYEKEFKTQTGNANPIIRQNKKVNSEPVSTEPVTMEEKALAAVTKVMGGVKG